MRRLLLACALLCGPAHANMLQAIVGGNTTAGVGTWTLIAHTTFSTAGANGGTSSAIDCTGANMAIMAVPFASGLGSVTPSDSSSNSWTLVGGATTPPAGAHATLSVYTVISPTVSASQTFTVTSAGGHPGLLVECWKDNSGTPTSAGPGTSTPAGANGTVATQISGSTSLTSSGSNALVFAAISANDGSSTVFSIDSSFTVQDQMPAVGGGSIGGAIAFKLLPSVATVQPTWTLTPASTDGAGAGMNFYTP